MNKFGVFAAGSAALIFSCVSAFAVEFELQSNLDLIG